MAKAPPEITLKFYAQLKEKAGAEEAACRAARLRDALQFMKKNFSPEFVAVLGSCHIFLNGESVASMAGPFTRLKEGDVLHILPPSGGG